MVCPHYEDILSVPDYVSAGNQIAKEFMTEVFQSWLVLVHVTLMVETLVETSTPMSTRPGKLWL